MSDRPAVTKVSQDFVLQHPSEQSALIVAVSDWHHLRNRVNGIDSSTGLFHNIGCTFVGIAVSAFLAGVALPKAVDNLDKIVKVVFWSVFGCASALAVALFLLGWKLSRVEAATKADVVAEFDRLEARYRASAE